MGKFGIDYYKETKEKKEIEQEDQKKVLHEEKVKQIEERIEVCKTVPRVLNQKQKKPQAEKEETVEVIEEIIEEIIEMPDNDKQE